jgi:hypothetical protein
MESSLALAALHVLIFLPGDYFLKVRSTTSYFLSGDFQ